MVASASDGVSSAGPAAATKKKLTYKEQSANSPRSSREIHRTEELAKKLEAEMNDPAVIGDDKKFEEVSRAFAAAQSKVARLRAMGGIGRTAVAIRVSTWTAASRLP